MSIEEIHMHIMECIDGKKKVCPEKLERLSEDLNSQCEKMIGWMRQFERLENISAHSLIEVCPKDIRRNYEYTINDPYKYKLRDIQVKNFLRKSVKKMIGEEKRLKRE